MNTMTYGLSDNFEEGLLPQVNGLLESKSEDRMNRNLQASEIGPGRIKKSLGVMVT